MAIRNCPQIAASVGVIRSYRWIGVSAGVIRKCQSTEASSGAEGRAFGRRGVSAEAFDTAAAVPAWACGSRDEASAAACTASARVSACTAWACTASCGRGVSSSALEVGRSR